MITMSSNNNEEINKNTVYSNTLAPGLYKEKKDNLNMTIIIQMDGRTIESYGREEAEVTIYYDKMGFLKKFALRKANGSMHFFKLLSHGTIAEIDHTSKAKIRTWHLEQKKAIEISVIGYGETLKLASSRFSSIFRNKINITSWESCWMRECPTFNLKGEIDEWRSGDKVVGSTTCHKTVWEEFVRRANLLEPSNITQIEHYIIIFEQDAYCGVSNCGDMALQEVQLTTADILYLGWCYQKNTYTCPACAHAYALSLHGARVLLNRVYNCGGLADHQMRRAANDGFLSWATVKMPISITQTTTTKGLFIQNW